MVNPVLNMMLDRNANDEREKAVKMYNSIKGLSKVLAVAHREKGTLEKGVHDTWIYYVDRIMNHMKALRSDQKSIGRKLTIKQRVQNETREALDGMYQHSRKSVNFEDCGKPDVKPVMFGTRNGIPAYKHNVTVGWRWKEKIFNQFYKNAELPSSDYLVLSGEEIRTNHRGIRLFEVQAYGFKERLVMTMYVGQSSVGRKRAAIKRRHHDAIDAAIRLHQKEFIKAATGESHE